MYHILLPTDFSDQSWKALSFASYLFLHEPVEFHLLHIIPIPISQSEVGVIPDMSVFLESAEKDLTVLLGRFKELEHHDGSGFHTSAQLGTVVDTLHRYEVEFPEKTMVVMGTQGASGLAELFLGSTTTHVLSRTKSPIIVVPEKATLNPIERVIFAVGRDGIQHKKEILPLLEILKSLKVRLKIVHVQTDEETVLEAGNVTQVRLDQYLGSIDHAYDTLIGPYREDALMRYAEKDKANLVVLIKKDRGFWGNLFHRSLSKSLAFYGDIPLLIMHGE